MNDEKKQIEKNTFESDSHGLPFNYSSKATEMVFGKYDSSICVSMC